MRISTVHTEKGKTMSYNYGKQEVREWVQKHFPTESTILDVGAQEGTWRRLLPEYPNMDAVEAFTPNAEKLTGYRNVFNEDIRDMEYGGYDLIIFGDVIEHMSVIEAVIVLEYAKPRCRDMIIAVPFLYPQGEVYGNPYEVHVQDDLTHDLFMERYDGFEILVNPGNEYMYYHKKGAK